MTTRGRAPKRCGRTFEEPPRALTHKIRIGNHALAERSNDRDRFRRAAEHLPGQMPHRATAGQHAADARAMATTEGSSRTTPAPGTPMSVLAVPKSMAKSGPNSPETKGSILARGVVCRVTAGEFAERCIVP